MTDNSKKVLAFFQQNPDKEFTRQDLVEELDLTVPQTSGVISFVKKGYLTERREDFPPLTSSSKATSIRWYKITDEGMKFDPIQEERRLAREQAEARAIRKAERAKEKAERALKNVVQ